jgi:Uma2 family endonuclease
LIVPQFAVEVVSPSNSFKKLLRRATKFQRAGTHIFWIVNDDPLEIHVFEPSGRRIVTSGENLTLPELLPGFSMEASQLLPPA